MIECHEVFLLEDEMKMMICVLTPFVLVTGILLIAVGVIMAMPVMVSVFVPMLPTGMYYGLMFFVFFAGSGIFLNWTYIDMLEKNIQSGGECK